MGAPCSVKTTIHKKILKLVNHAFFHPAVGIAGNSSFVSDMHNVINVMGNHMAIDMHSSDRDSDGDNDDDDAATIRSR